MIAAVLSDPHCTFKALSRSFVRRPERKCGPAPLMMDRQVPTEIAMRGMLDRPEQELILVVEDAVIKVILERGWQSLVCDFSFPVIERSIVPSSMFCVYLLDCLE